MSFRVDVSEDCKIVIQRFDSTKGKWFHTPFDNLLSALIVIKLFLKNDLRQAKAEKFEPQFVKETKKEARESFNQLMEKSPYGKQGIKF